MVDEQDRLCDLALKLRRIEKRLRTMRSHLREPGSREELEEIPAGEILPVVANLESGAGLTPEALRESRRQTGASRSWLGSSRNEVGETAIALARPPSGWLSSPSGSKSSAPDGGDPRPDGSHAWRDAEAPIWLSKIPIAIEEAPSRWRLLLSRREGAKLDGGGAHPARERWHGPRNEPAMRGLRREV